MTRIVLLLNDDYPITVLSEDPRPPREVMAAINTGQMRVGSGEVELGRQALWAMAHPSVNVVTVVVAEPPVRLSARHYAILFGLADGQTLNGIAEQHGISPRTAQMYLMQMKDRLKAHSVEEVVARAAETGLLGD